MPEEIDIDDEFTDGQSNNESVGSSLSDANDISVKLKDDKAVSTPIRRKLQFLADSASKHSSSPTLATSFLKYAATAEDKKPAHKVKSVKRKHVEDDEDDRKSKVREAKHTTTEVDKEKQYDVFLEQKIEDACLEFLAMQEKEQAAKNKTA